MRTWTLTLSTVTSYLKGVPVFNKCWRWIPTSPTDHPQNPITPPHGILPPLTDPVPRSQLPHYKILFRCLCSLQKPQLPGRLQGRPHRPQALRGRGRVQRGRQPALRRGRAVPQPVGGEGLLLRVPRPRQQPVLQLLVRESRDHRHPEDHRGGGGRGFQDGGRDRRHRSHCRGASHSAQ